MQWNSNKAIQNPKGWCQQSVALNMSANLEDPAVATGKGQSSSQFPRRVVLNNVLTIRHLHSSPMLVRSCWKSCILGFSVNVNQELPDTQAGFRKGRGTRDQIANICWIIEKAKGFQKKTSTSVSLTMLKLLTVWIITNYGKFLMRWEYPTILLVSWESCM